MCAATPNGPLLPGSLAALPDSLSTLWDLLPLAHRLADEASAAAIARVRAEGQTVSCRAGCAACCRQLVTVALPEAAYLSELVAAMPAERQTAIRRRFAEVVGHLEEAGLLDSRERPGGRHLKAPAGLPADQVAHAIAVKYFSLRLPCPFLENESCSIYAARPTACRECCVTSPAEWCQNVFQVPVEHVFPDLRMGPVLMAVGERVAGLPREQIPLALALEWGPVVEPAVRAPRDNTELQAAFADAVREFADRRLPSPLVEAAGPTRETMTAHVELRIAQRHVRLTLSVPSGPATPRDLLPIAHHVVEMAAKVATEDVQAAGETVSCRAGCGACCRQLVPLSEAEAHQLADLARNMPEPRGSQVLSRFAHALQQLQQAGLLEPLRNRHPLRSDERMQLGLSYFHRGIPCPFLEHESCSIYVDRPLVCREYLVTSPAAHCGQPTADNIRRVALPIPAPLFAFATFASGVGRGEAVPWVPLVLALEWAAANVEPAAEVPGPLLAERLFRQMTGAK